jgi:ankyrin repeat protein
MGADVDCKTAYGMTPLHFTAWHGYTEILRFLVRKGANVSCKANDGETPLHFASSRGQLDAAFVLIVHGADLSIKNNNGKTPLEVTENKDVATKLTNFVPTLRRTCPAAIEDKLKTLIQENKQQEKSEIVSPSNKWK